MSKITVLLFSTLLIVIMQSTSAFYYNITDHIMYRCTDLGEIDETRLQTSGGQSLHGKKFSLKITLKFTVIVGRMARPNHLSCHNHLPPCCGEERRLHTTPVIRCKQWSLLIPHEKRCQRMPNDYYMYFTDNDK